jgi:hypothetical protein
MILFEIIKSWFEVPKDKPVGREVHFYQYQPFLTKVWRSRYIFKLPLYVYRNKKAHPEDSWGFCYQVALGDLDYKMSWLYTFKKPEDSSSSGGDDEIIP